MLENAKKSGAKKSLAVEKDLGGQLDDLVAFSNGGRASIGIKRLHVERAIRLVVDGSPLAWTFGARSLSSRVAFVLVARDGDAVTVLACDVRRVDAYKGPANIFKAIGDFSGTLEKNIEGETPEKIEAARVASRGIELHALAQLTDPALRERVKILSKSAKTHEAGPQGDLEVRRVRTTFPEATKFLGIEA